MVPVPIASRPLVSVVIPAFDAERFVATAIDSALAQTYPNVEVVVVDDGSTDGTATILARYGTRIVTVRQENRGLAGARNAGLRAATGDLLALLDADDAWLPDRLERCVALLEARPEIGIVTTDAYLVDDTTPTRDRYYGAYQRYPFPAEDRQLEEISQRNFLFVSVVFRRALLDRCGMFDETMRRAEDYELWTRFLLSGARVGLVPEPLALYSVRPDSLSRAKGAQWEAHMAVLERHLPELWRHGVGGRSRDAYAIGQRLAARGDRRRAASFFLMAARGDELSLGARIKYVTGALQSLAGRSA